MMKPLFDNDFIAYYGILSRNAVADEYPVNLPAFDIDDTVTPPVVPYKAGQLSVNASEDVDILAYEKFIDKCKTPKSFAAGRRRCDFLLTTHSTNNAVCLVEMTSALGSASKLSLPIRDSHGNVRYPGGKMEKVEDQLSQSLSTVMAVPAIQSNLASRSRKICLMSYIINPYTNIVDRIRHPLMRFLGIEAKEVKNDGAIVSCPAIEAFGFEYRRISHDYAFNL